MGDTTELYKRLMRQSHEHTSKCQPALVPRLVGHEAKPTALGACPADPQLLREVPEFSRSPHVALYPTLNHPKPYVVEVVEPDNTVPQYGPNPY